MFLPRATQTVDGTNSTSCSSGELCPPSVAIVGQDPSEKESDEPAGPANFDRPGPHRYIGIGIVAGLSLLAVLLWLVFGRWPRRMAREHCCSRRTRKQSHQPENIQVDLDRALAVLEKPKRCKTKDGREGEKMVPKGSNASASESMRPKSVQRYSKAHGRYVMDWDMYQYPYHQNVHHMPMISKTKESGIG